MCPFAVIWEEGLRTKLENAAFNCGVEDPHCETLIAMNNE